MFSDVRYILIVVPSVSSDIIFAAALSLTKLKIHIAVLIGNAIVGGRHAEKKFR